MAIDLSKYKKATTTQATGSQGIDLSKYKKTQTQPEDTESIGSKVLGGITNVGVGIGSTIGKAGLGLGQTTVKGVGALGDLLSKGKSKNYTEPVVQGIELIKQNIFEKPFEKELSTPSGKAGSAIGTASLYLAPSSSINKAQAGITGLVSRLNPTSTLGKAVTGVLGVAGRAVPEAVGAGAVGLADSGGDISRAKQDAFLGGTFSAAFGTLGALGRGIKDTGALKSLYSKTTGIPRTAFDAVDGVGINKGATPEQALTKSRDAVKLLRRKTSKEWQETIPKIVETYQGKRLLIPETQAKKLLTVANEFGLDPDVIPQNLKNVSALESINLMKALNELDSLSIKASPKGAVVRSLKKELKDIILKSFGGADSEIGKLWSNYARKSEILNNMDSIVSTYKTKPTQTVTAKNRLMAIFDENKPEFLQAVKEIEDELGINLTRDIASTKFERVLPKGILKADGGLPTQAGIIDKIVKALLLPVTSPKLAGKLAVSGGSRPISDLERRVFGNYRQVKNSSSPTIQTNAINPNIPKSNISNNITNSIDNSTKKSSGFLNSIKKKIDETPNKQGGFIKIGKQQEKGLPKTANIDERLTPLVDKDGMVTVYRASAKFPDTLPADTYVSTKPDSTRYYAESWYKGDPKDIKVESFKIPASKLKRGGTKDNWQLTEDFKWESTQQSNSSLPKSKVNESVSSSNNSTLLKEAKKYKSAEELGIDTKEGGHLLDQLDDLGIDSAKISSNEFGNLIELDERDLMKQTTGKLRSNYWLDKIEKGERPNVLVGVENGKLKVIDGNHKASAYLKVGSKDIPTIFTREAKSQLEQIWKEANKSRK